MSRILFAALFLAFASLQSASAQTEKTEVAIFAGGCFWCVESDFDRIDGVLETTSGYIGGEGKDPTYETHATRGFREAVAIRFDPARVAYADLLDAFFHSVDPTDAGGQFCDRGHSYTTAIYTVEPDQKKAAVEAKTKAEAELGKPVVTPIETATEFYPAEGYHQDYYRKNPIRYKFYRFSCGRDNELEQLWGSAAHRGLGH